MSHNLSEITGIAQAAQALLDNPLQLHWVPYFVARPLVGGSQYTFDKLDNVHVASADGHSLVIGLRPRDKNNENHEPHVAAAIPELRFIDCGVAPLAAPSTATNMNVQVEFGGILGIIEVPLDTNNMGLHEVKVAGRIIKANVPLLVK